jgi:hypothetical protein
MLLDWLDDSTLSGSVLASTLDKSPSIHLLPLPPRGMPLQGTPPLPPPPRFPKQVEHPHRFELHVISHTQSMNDAEAVLANALVIMIIGNRPPVSSEQVHHHLTLFYGVSEEDMQLKRYSHACNTHFSQQ